MILQRHIRADLYDYLTGGLAEQDRERIRKHLGRCRVCSNELRTIQEALDLLPPRLSGLAKDQPDSYWNNFIIGVLNSLGSPAARTIPVSDWSLKLFPGYRLGLGVSIAFVLAGILIGAWLVENFRTQEDSRENADRLAVVIDDRTSTYLRRAGVLLTEIANRSDEDETHPDVSVERMVSRELLDEARYLRAQRPEDYSTSVVVDLEPILIELANAEEGDPRPSVRLVQDAIRDNNVLFRVRMAQATLKSDVQHKAAR